MDSLSPLFFFLLFSFFFRAEIGVELLLPVIGDESIPFRAPKLIVPKSTLKCFLRSRPLCFSFSVDGIPSAIRRALIAGDKSGEDDFLSIVGVVVFLCVRFWR